MPTPTATPPRLDWTERDGHFKADAECDGGFVTGRLVQYDDSDYCAGRWNWQAECSAQAYTGHVGTSGIVDTREQAEAAIARALPVLLDAARRLAVVS